jgi:trk system potassium uptake protein TrkH
VIDPSSGATIDRRWRLQHAPAALIRRSLTPSRLLVLSFLALVTLGTMGMMWLPGLYVDEPLSWIDALFTVTSAVCVTGLSLVDVGTQFTLAGQVYLLFLIQLGGLGILTFTTLVILALGRRLSLHQEAVTADTAGIAPDVDFRQLVRSVVAMTFLFEAVGALILFAGWLPRFPPAQAAWFAIFHAVSAFCNAGFSTFTDSLIGYQDDPLTLSVIMALIILGGLGFLTLEELRLRWLNKSTRAAPPLSLHSRLALATTAVMLVLGWISFTVLEWGQTFAQMPAWEKALNGLFMSVTARTAGFATVDYGATADSTNFITILLMSVGGSPGSTAGGLKTTTVAVITLLAIARLRGHEFTSVQHRTLPEETVQRAVGLFTVGFVALTGAILLYTIFQLEPLGPSPGGRFLDYMFEAASAFNTVGLTAGVTQDLTPFGKLLTVTLMYLGRVGPLTFATAIALNRRRLKEEFRYAHEDVIIG